MRYLFQLFVVFLLLCSGAIAQSGYVFTGAKSIKPEHAPKPEDFKTKELSWGEMDSKCRADADIITHGNWFKLYPTTTRLKVVVGTGMPFGTISDPYIYIGYLDTVDGIEVLVEHDCAKYQGVMGQFKLETFNLTPQKLYYLLIGGNAKKQTFELYLTQRFAPENPPPPPPEERAHEDLVAEDPIPSVSEATAKQTEGQAEQILPSGEAVIIGRLRNANGNVLVNTNVMLLNDDLKQINEVKTDEYGGFRFEGVNPDKINLVKMSQDDGKWLIDMFLYDENFDVIGKPIPLGHRLHSFRAREDYFQDLRILTQQDVFVDVEQGGSYMTGRVVDKETYLLGREGVKVGLYNTTKRLVKTATTDLNGRFSFYELEQQDYIVKVEHNPNQDYVEIVIADSFNVPYQTANSNDIGADGFFKFRALPREIVELRREEILEDRGIIQTKHEAPKVLIDEKKVGIAIELSTIEFNTASAQLTLAKNRELDQLAKELISKPAVRIKIDGHTDNVGSASDNKQLSDERAAAVKRYLVLNGVASDRIVTEGYGASKPIATNDTEEGRSKNRRVEFTVLD